MTRVQRLRAPAVVTIASSAVPEPLSSTSLFVKSVTIKASPTNTDFVYVGTDQNQESALEPNGSCNITGDGLDYGAYAMIDLSTIYIRAEVSGESVSYMYLEGI